MGPFMGTTNCVSVTTLAFIQRLIELVGITITSELNKIPSELGGIGNDRFTTRAIIDCQIEGGREGGTVASECGWNAKKAFDNQKSTQGILFSSSLYRIA